MAALDEDAALVKVGLRVAELREQRGLTQADFAKMMGVQLRHAQRYESGTNMTLVTLIRLANALKVAPSDFFVTPRRGRRKPGRPGGRGKGR